MLNIIWCNIMEPIYCDALTIIFSFLSLKNLIKLEPVCKKFKNIIRSHKWNIKVRLYDVDKIKYVLDNYNFVNYDLSYSLISDDIVKKLSYCHTLDLTWCVLLTDESLKYLNNCKNLKLDYCSNITNSIKIDMKFRSNDMDDKIKKLAEYYISAVYFNNIKIIKFIEKLFGPGILHIHCKNLLIKKIYACNIIKSAIKGNNLKILKTVEKYICLDKFFQAIKSGCKTCVNDPIIDAAEHGNLEIFKYLHSKENNLYKNDDSCLRIAIEKGHYDIVKYILESEEIKQLHGIELY
jgi:hypothetical protein